MICKLFHFRTQDNKEVDFMIEKRNGDIICIEVKNSKTIKTDDFNHLRFLKSILKDKFIRGIVLYKGKDILPFEERMTAMPVSTLWERWV